MRSLMWGTEGESMLSKVVKSQQISQLSARFGVSAHLKQSKQMFRMGEQGDGDHGKPCRFGNC